MKAKLFKTTLAALAFATLATSGNIASAGVTSTAIGNAGAIAPISQATGETNLVHYRYYGHSHRNYRPRYRQRRSYYDGCRRVKQRYWDGYGYSYRWIRQCR